MNKEFKVNQKGATMVTISLLLDLSDDSVVTKKIIDLVECNFIGLKSVSIVSWDHFKKYSDAAPDLILTQSNSRSFLRENGKVITFKIIEETELHLLNSMGDLERLLLACIVNEHELEVSHFSGF